MKEVAVVDGNNVAYEEKSRNGKAKLGNIMAMKHLLQNRGYTPIIIVDATLRYEIDDPQQYERLEHEQEILQAPAGTPADYFVIKTAEKEQGIIVSNDRYDDYQHEFPWVRGKRIPFMIVDGNVFLYGPKEEELSAEQG